MRMKMFRSVLGLTIGFTGIFGFGALGQPTTPEARVPLTRPGEMPSLDRSKLGPFEDKLASFEAQANTRWIMDTLWATTLGQEYLAYLTDPIPFDKVPGRALHLLDLVFSQGKHLAKRQKAIEAFTLDLYARGKMTEDVLKRSVIFQTTAKVKEMDGMDSNSNRVIQLAIVGAVAAFTVASPAAREELLKLRKTVFHHCRVRRCDVLPQIQWAKMLSWSEFTNKYEWWTAWNTFGLIAGGGSMLYSFGFEKLPGFQKNTQLDRDMLDGREDLLIELEF